MDIVCETDRSVTSESVLDNQGALPSGLHQQNNNNCTGVASPDYSGPSNAQSPEHRYRNQQQQLQQKAKRKHRRGKPKPKNANKPFKKTNWKFQIPRRNCNYKDGNGARGAPKGGSSNRTRVKLARPRSLVPYNTNKFLMEEHLAEVPSSLLTPSGRTRDSSFSVDSDENYFYSLPEDEEEFLTKEFDNIYEKARVERLENLTKQQLIEQLIDIEDRYSTDQGTQRQQQLNVQLISSEFITKIRVLEEKIRELTKENFNLRNQLLRSTTLAAAAAASPPSATAPTASACQPTSMESSSQDSESDSSTSSSSSVSSASFQNADNEIEEDDDECQDILNYEQARVEILHRDAQNVGLQHYDELLNELRSASTSRSSLSQYDMAAIAQSPQVESLQQVLDVEMQADDKSNDSVEAVDSMVEKAADPNAVKNRSPSPASKVPQTPP